MKVKINKNYYKVVLNGDFVLPPGVGHKFEREIEVFIGCDKDRLLKNIVMAVSDAYIEEYCLFPRLKTNSFGFEKSRFCELIAWYGVDIINSSTKIYKYILGLKKCQN